MNLLNRYLEAVGRLLPKDRRDDIIAELGVNLLSEMEDKEEALGRPLSEDEEGSILHRYGNPTLVAGRYREPNLGLAFGVQLIGPELFPIYRNVLGLILSITLCILAVVAFLVAKMTGETVTFARLFAPLPIQLAVTTLIFILIDRGKDHVLNRWDPRQLPAVKQEPEEGPTVKNIFNFIMLVVGTAWMALTPRWPYLMLGPGAFYLPALQLKFWPYWPLFYGAIIALLCAGVVLAFLCVFLRLPRRKAAIIDLVLRGLAIGIGLSLLLSGPNYVSSPYKDVAEWANSTFVVCVAVALAIHVWRAVWMIRSLFRESHQMLPARQY